MILWLAQLMRMRLTPPEKSSAPAITASISPSENPIPAIHLVGPYPRVDPVEIVVASTAPRPMKAPANTPSTNNVTVGAFAFVTPLVSTARRSLPA